MLIEYIRRIQKALNLEGGDAIKDSKGKKISIGDRVKVLWKFDNKFYSGDVVKIQDKMIEIEVSPIRNITATSQTLIVKNPV